MTPYEELQLMKRGSVAEATVVLFRTEYERIQAESHRLKVALSIIKDAHAQPERPGESCAEGCGGRWPCFAWGEADVALRGE